MRIYALPDTGPQLTLLDRAELLRPQLTINGRQIQFQGEREEEDDDFRSTLGEEGRPLRAELQTALNGQQDQPGAGPIVRCSSDRSNPVAHLRFFINNQPVAVSRTLENSTMSYSDGLESNVVSFRVQLSDFLATDASGLDKAASLKSPSDNEKSKNKTTSTTTTTTTTSTTPKPTVKLEPKGKSKPSKEKKKQSDKKKTNPNAGVQFDDENSANSRLGKADKNKQPQSKDKARGEQQQQQRRKERKRKPSDGSGAHFGGANFLDLNEFHELDSNKDVDGPIDETVNLIKEFNSVPAMGDNSQQKQNSIAQANTTTGGMHNEQIKSIKRRDKANPMGMDSGWRSKLDKLGVAEQRLVKQEQGGARTISSRIGALRDQNNNQQQQQARVYSNFIRIRCASLVPNLGYEMTSELTVPLTLLVPASQLSDTLRQVAALSPDNPQTRQGEANRRSDNERETSSQSGDSSRVLRNGGSLQAPRTVSIDRVAQASGHPRLFHSPQDKLKQEPPVSNGAGRLDFNLLAFITIILLHVIRDYL